MIEVFAEKQSNGFSDLDDVYLDSLKIQGEKLFIHVYISHFLNQLNSGKPMELVTKDIEQLQIGNDAKFNISQLPEFKMFEEQQIIIKKNKKELKKELKEKERIENELKKLENKK